uniref:Uncharacterized protein LOC104244876 n=1 Tax=Nicotiana sylvestris TaxID=4096 RepID=A0A1U7Y3I9_NICSY|nr:PREDICTED: uncharacterized protein LOC104244876 [Nicotiana sylvestris]
MAFFTALIWNFFPSCLSVFFLGLSTCENIFESMKICQLGTMEEIDLYRKTSKSCPLTIFGEGIMDFRCDSWCNVMREIHWFGLSFLRQHIQAYQVPLVSVDLSSSGRFKGSLSSCRRSQPRASSLILLFCVLDLY